MPSSTKILVTLFLATFAVARPAPQLAGEGSAANSLLSDTDNGVGYGIENAEDNLAGNVAALRGGAGAPPALHRRQGDKIAKGAQTLSNAAGTGQETESITSGVVNLDGTSTSGAAAIGADVGSTEEGALEEIGGAVPRK